MARGKKEKGKKEDVVTEELTQSVSPESTDNTTEEENSNQKPVIHIIIRTHRRPEYFKRCIESLRLQEYMSRVIHVIADDSESADYANEALNEGLIDDVIRVYPAEYTNKFGDFTALKKAGLCTKDRDNRRHFYDLYLNEVVAGIDEGWIFFVDDDKEVPAGVLGNIADGIDNNGGTPDQLIIGQYQMKTRLVPRGENWNAPFKRGHVDMSCFVFHSKYKEFAKLDGHGAGDFRAACRLQENIKSHVWIEIPFTIADNDGNFGKTEK